MAKEKELQCYFCHKTFTSTSKKAVFCSSACRLRFFRQKQQLIKRQIAKRSELDNSTEEDDLEVFHKFLGVVGH
jgi:hypothetical protein